MSKDKTGRVVFIGNIPYAFTEKEVTDLFSKCGTVLNFRIVYDKETGKPKGFGFAEFASADEAATAVRNLNNHDIGGRQLRVDYSNEAGGSGGGGGGGGGGDSSNKHQQQSQQQAQHWQQMQAQQPPQQQSQQPPPSYQSHPQVPIGVTLPDNISAPDAISRTLSAYDPGELLTVVSHLKNMVNTDPGQVQTLFATQPQLAYAVFQALLLMGLVDPSILGQLVETSQRSQPMPPQPPPQQTPMPFQPPPQQYAPQPPPQQHMPQFPPHLQQQPPMMGTPPIHNQGYAPPPMAGPPKPPHIADGQWDSIRQICSIPQQQIDMMPNPTERNSIMTIRQQYMSYFPQIQQFRGIPGY